MSWDVSYLRHASTASLTIYYPAGVVSNVNASTNFARDQLMLLPWPTGHGGAIVGMGFTGLQVASRCLRVGLYHVTAARDPYPGLLFADLGSAVPNTDGVRLTLASPVVYPAHTALWLGILANSQYTTNRVAWSVLPGWIGVAARTDFSGGHQVLTVSWGFASGLPSTCPQSATISTGGFPPVGLAVSSIVPT